MFSVFSFHCRTCSMANVHNNTVADDPKNTSCGVKRKIESKYWSGNESRSSSRSNSEPFKKTKVTQVPATSKSNDEETASTQDDSQSDQTRTDAKMKPLTRSFFDVPCTDLAKKLLGQRIVCLQGSERLSGRIVETEAYLGFEDKAAHTYQGKRTERNKAMYMDPGTSYVYNIYGMYCCLNISSKGDGAAVLIRALEAVEGKDSMRAYRQQKKSKTVKDKELTNGPSKLCQALNINKGKFNQIDLTSSPLIWLEEDEMVEMCDIVTSARINIGYAEEWTDKPLRFYVLGNEYVSVKDKKAEKELKK